MSTMSHGTDFNVVMIVPTGIGAEIGGHAGDACAAARLLGSVCDTLILHPNVVNGSDINEMPQNSLYVEGGLLDRFLERKTRLLRVRSNRVLVAANSPIPPELVNAVSAARVTLGVEAEIVELKTPLHLVGQVSLRQAHGIVEGWRELVNQVRDLPFDALAIWSTVETDAYVAYTYLREGGINPWGKAEAELSRLVGEALDKPVAHAPKESDVLKGFNEIVDPRKAAELVSVCYLHCVLKGLHRAPRPHKPCAHRTNQGLSADDVHCLVSPYGCHGRPHKACVELGIPVVTVRENRTAGPDTTTEGEIIVENYLEAAGLLAAMRAGVSMESVRRPIGPTAIEEVGEDMDQ